VKDRGALLDVVISRACLSNEESHSEKIPGAVAEYLSKVMMMDTLNSEKSRKSPGNSKVLPNIQKGS